MGYKTNQVRDLYRVAGVRYGSSPFLLARYVDLCLADKAFSELAVIAAEPLLPAEIHHQLGEVKDAKVRSAWVASSARNSEELQRVFPRESRKAVQLAFAGRADLWADAYIELAGSKFPEVRSAVISNDAAPLEAARAVLSLSPSRLPVTADRMRIICEQHPELVNDLAGRLQQLSADAVGVVLEFHADSTVLRDGMTRLDRILRVAAKDGRTHTVSTTMRSTYAALCRLALNPDAEAEVRGEARTYIDAWASIPGLMAGNEKANAVKKFAASPPERSAHRRRDMLADARVTADAEALANYAAIAIEHRDVEIVAAMVTNPNTPRSMMEAWAQSHLYSFNIAEAAARIGDRQRIVTLFALFLRMVGNEEVMSQPDPRRFAADVISEAIANHHHMVHHKLANWEVADITVLERAPLSLLLQTQLRPDQLKQLADRLDADLGVNETRYELFETLGKEMTVPLAELLETCKLMAPDAEPEPVVIDEPDTPDDAEDTLCSQVPWTQLTLV